MTKRKKPTHRTLDDRMKMLGKIEKLRTTGMPVVEAEKSLGLSEGQYYQWKKLRDKNPSTTSVKFYKADPTKQVRRVMRRKQVVESGQLVALVGSKSAIIDAIRSLNEV